MKLSTAFFIAAAFLLPFELSAASINEQQANQHARIQQGIASGELTKKEANKLIQEQKRIAKKEKRYRADGVLTQWERADLKSDLARSSDRIYVQKHDWQDRH